MNKFEKFLNKWNFKKITIVYLITAFAALIVCAGITGYIYRNRLNFAWQYSKIKETKDDAGLKDAINKTSGASEDVIDVLLVDDNNQVIYSAKQSEFAGNELKFTKAGNEKKYLVSDKYPDAVFCYVKNDEFMLKSILNKDFGKIREDYDDDSVFEDNISSKSIYMLSRIKVHDSSNKVYVITTPTTVQGGMTIIKITAVVAVLILCVYWVLVALWIFKDAAGCRLAPVFWGMIGLFTNIIGLLVYKIYKRNMTLCPSCGMAQSKEYMYCSSCGTKLGLRCEKCGCKVNKEDKYCHHCGEKMN